MPEPLTRAELEVLPTTAQLADHFGHKPRRLLQRAAERSIEPAGRIGRVIYWPFNAYETLKPRRPGRPSTKEMAENGS